MEYINGSSVSNQNAINAQFKSVKLNSSSLPGYNPSNLDVYETAQLINLAVSGFTTAVNTGILATRIGNIISLNILQFAAISNGNNIVIAGALPERFRPVINLQFLISARDSIQEAAGSNFIVGILEITALTGNITITRTANKLAFNNTATAGIPTLNINFQQ
jgi:hypothetical protein